LSELVDDNDPELQHLKTLYRAELETALAAARSRFSQKRHQPPDKFAQLAHKRAPSPFSPRPA
jgi:hypothetical protein